MKKVLLRCIFKKLELHYSTCFDFQSELHQFRRLIFSLNYINSDARCLDIYETSTHQEMISESHLHIGPDLPPHSHPPLAETDQGPAASACSDLPAVLSCTGVHM